MAIRTSDRSAERRDCSDSEAIALQALVWILSEPARADRLLGLTGLSPDDLRARIGDPHLLVAALQFLSSHEPDLIACAAELEMKPERILAAERVLA